MMPYRTQTRGYALPPVCPKAQKCWSPYPENKQALYQHVDSHECAHLRFSRAKPFRCLAVLGVSVTRITRIRHRAETTQLLQRCQRRTTALTPLPTPPTPYATRQGPSHTGAPIPSPSNALWKAPAACQPTPTTFTRPTIGCTPSLNLTAQGVTTPGSTASQPHSLLPHPLTA